MMDPHQRSVKLSAVMAAACLVAAVGSAGAQTPWRESFAGSVKQLRDWTVLGVAAVEVEPTASRRALAIEGCGFAESPGIDIEPGARYRVAGQARTEDDWQNNSCLKVKWYGANGEVVSWEYLQRRSLSQDWRRYEKVVIAPAEAARAAVVCHAQAVWGRKSYFAEVSLAKADTPPGPMLDLRFDGIEDGFIHDHSPYRNDAEAYLLGHEDLLFSLSGPGVLFSRPEAKLRFLPSRSLAPSTEQWVLALNFYPEEPVSDDSPAQADYILLDATDYVLLVRKQPGQSDEAVWSLLVQFRSPAQDPSQRPVYFHRSLPVKPWRWHELVVKVDRVAGLMTASVVIDGRERVEASTPITAPLDTTAALVTLGGKDYPRTTTPGFRGRVSALRIYDSFEAFESARTR